MIRRSGGYTIVEVVVVVVVIAILIGLVVVSLSSSQTRSRDAKREGSARIIAEALEKYYEKNGEYPSCPLITDTAQNLTNNTLIGLDQAVLLTPGASSSTTNSIQCTDLTTMNQPDFFAYVGDGSVNCQTGDACLSFKLKYKKEVSKTIGVINSRYATDIATSGTPTLTTTVNGFTSGSLSWSSVKNSINYTLERATNSAFTQNYTSRTVSAVNASDTDLSYDTTYYYRVRANSNAGAGPWSATKTLKTWNLATPTITASTISSTSVRGTWSAISHASGYVAQCSTNGTTWNTSCQSSTITGTNHTFTGRAQGTRYYVRVKAVNGSYESAWSNAPSTITTIDNPAAHTISSSNTLPNWNYLNATSNAVCPAGTTPSYDWYANGGFWVSGTQHKTVSYALSWNTSVTLTVASRCTTSVASSSFVWATNSASMSLPAPWVTVWLPGDSNMYWQGSCPNWTTSHNFYWRTNGRIGAAGNTTGQYPGTYYSPGTWWGNGRAWVTLTCNGPWGSAAADANSMYGPGCVPTPTVSECWQ